jgi:hemoglobin/transferrin/lactoferrin receptor protein
VQDIRDLAKDLPNVSVKRAPARFGITGRGNPTGADANAGFSIRGLGGNRVLMLVDGVRLPRSYINGSTAFGRDSVDLGLVERVEIVHGPSSALYGSDGLAGLVNFITLSPADILKDSNGTLRDSGGRAWASYSGDDNGTTLGATVAHRAGDSAEWSLTGSAGHAQGLKNMGSNDSAHVDRTTPNPQTNNSASLLGKLVWRPENNQSHTFSFEHVQKNADVTLLSSALKSPVALPLTYNTLSATQKSAAVAAAVTGESANQDQTRNRLSWNASYGVTWPIADRVTTLLSWQNSQEQEDGTTRLATQWTNDGLRQRETAYEEQGVQASVQVEKTWTVSSDWAHKLTYGLDWSQTDVSSFADGSDPAPITAYVPKHYFPDTRDTAQALYVQSEWFSERWSVTPGVRFDQFSLDVLRQDGYYPTASATPGKSLSGSAVSPKLGLMFKVTPQWSLYGNYATGFRAPEGQQVNSTLEVSTAKLLPNPDLKPETSRTLELGAKGRWSQLALDVAVFSSRFVNLIQEKKDLGTANGLAASITNPTLFQTVNIDRASISGVEIRGLYQWGPMGGGRLSSPFSYGSTRGTNDVTGLPLNSIEPAKLSVGLAYSSAAWDLGLTMHHQAGKSASDLDSRFIPKSTSQLQFLPEAVTTLDLHSQWRARKGVRLNLAVINLTDKKYWNWSDVQGVASNATPLVVDAYTQPGRHVNLSLLVDF